MAEVYGELLDGISTAAQQVVLRPEDRGLCITTPDGGAVVWQFTDIGSVGKSASGYFCSLRHAPGAEAPTVCFTDAILYHELRSRINETHHPLKQVFEKLWRLHWWQILIVTAVLIAAFFWIFFTLLLRAYTLTPEMYDLHLGNKFDSSIARVYERCTSPQLDTFLNKAMVRLSLSGDRFPHRVVVLNYATENAISIPGGTIYLFRGLLESSNTPDEILGVLSHEIVHAEKRHSVRQIISSMGIYYMSSLAIGMAIDGVDMLDGLESTLEMSSLFFTLRYSRDFEREADSLGIVRLHNAGLRVGPLDSLLTRITPKPRGRNYLLSLLSTHPLQQERSERFTRAREHETFAQDTVFRYERAQWSVIKKGCSANAKKVPLWKKLLR